MREFNKHLSIVLASQAYRSMVMETEQEQNISLFCKFDAMSFLSRHRNWYPSYVEKDSIQLRDVKQADWWR
jgi:hypothetical protein